MALLLAREEQQPPRSVKPPLDHCTRRRFNDKREPPSGASGERDIVLPTDKLSKFLLVQTDLSTITLFPSDPFIPGGCDETSKRKKKENKQDTHLISQEQDTHLLISESPEAKKVGVLDSS